MKRIVLINPITTVLRLAMLFTVVALFTSCQKQATESIKDKSSNATVENNDVSSNSAAPLKIDAQRVYLFIEDAKMQVPTGANTLLYDNRGHTPLLAPDGHQITLGEYNMVSGRADIKCIRKGTHVTVHAQGLIPNGIYTIWTLTFKSPGFDGTFGNLIGNGALGAPDGSENAFTASAGGTADISVIMPAESLSLFGSVPNCLGEVFETHLVAAYHSDHLTHGGSPGDPTTWIVQFAFPFYGAQL